MRGDCLATFARKNYYATLRFHIKLIKTKISIFSWRQNCITLHMERTYTTSRLLQNQKIIVQQLQACFHLWDCLQQSYTSCATVAEKSFFSISAATFAKNIFDLATVCFLSTYKVTAVCLLHDCCSTCFILKLVSATFLFFT